MTATPTPGDLSARQVIADMQSVAELRTIRHSYIGEKLKGWIAALSALPAAGGLAPVLTAYRCDYCGRDYYDTANCCESRREYLAAFTTPQPSAAEGAVDREELLKDYLADYEFLGDDAGYRPNERELLLIEDALRGWEALDEPRAIPADAAVGAQGDGEWLQIPAFLRREDPTVGPEVHDALMLVNDAANDARHRGEYDKANKLVKARLTLYRAAAPAAGKGVDDAMVDSVRAGIMASAANEGRCDVVIKDEWVRAALETALTRQPVAGDGK